MSKIDISAVKRKLEKLQSATTRVSNLWKPPQGKTEIRIVPYNKSTDGLPFIELFFHYEIGGKTYLSPITFGRPDPIEEFAEKLKSSGNTEDWKFGNKVTAKMRTFAPIIVRGEEKEGIKFWGFGKTVYHELLSLIADPDYGDITDAINGTDIVVEFQTAEEIGASYPKTTIRAKRATSAITENQALLDTILNDQKDITEIYKEKTYDELKEILGDWLNTDNAEDDSDATKDTPTVIKAKTPTPTKDVDKEFKQLFEDD